ncbi:MAG TPA: N-methyl-L-tryptophan oxidase [Caulobacteraceae bacterium]
MSSSADVIVVGLGAAGAATLFQLSKRGVRVLGIDRHTPPHDLGSSHGQSRITRQAIGEGADYAPLALRAHQLWREMEAQTGENLMLTTGCLVIGPLDIGEAPLGKPKFVRRTIEVAERFAIPHEVLDAGEIRRRFPQFSPRESEVACFEPGGGLVHPERCIAAQLALAARYGAAIRMGERVTSISQVGDVMEVTTEGATHRAAQVIVCAGPWTPGLLGGRYAADLGLYRQTMHWFEPRRAVEFAPERMPVFIWMHGGEGGWFYGFPAVDGEAGVKVASEQFSASLTAPEAAQRKVDAAEAAAMHALHVAGRLRGLSAKRLRSASCIYTMAPDQRFIVARDPDRDRMTVVSACSGHGFKHSPAIGEAVAQWLTGSGPPAMLAPFAG